MNAFLTLAGIINIGISLGAGLSAYFKNRSKSNHRTFLVFAIFVTLWIIGSLLPLGAELPLSLVFVGGIFFATSYLHFVATTIDAQKNRAKYIYILYGINCLIALTAVLQFYFSKTNSVFGNFLSGLNLDYLYNIWALIFVGTLVYAALLIFNNFQKSTGLKRFQMEYLLIEGILTHLIGLFLVFVHFDWSLSLAENLLSSPHIFVGVHVLALFYLSIEYKFIKVKLAVINSIKKFLAFLIAIIFAFSLYNTITVFFTELSALVGSIFIMAVVVLAYIKAFEILNSQLFFQVFKTSSLEHFRQIVHNFKNQNIFYESVAELEKNIQQNFTTKIDIKSARVILLDLEKKSSRYPHLENYFRKNGGFLVAAEEEYLAQQQHLKCDYLDELRALGDVIYPLYQNTDQLIGFFVLEKKISEDIYIEEELSLLKSIVHYIALSLMGIIYTQKLREQTEELLRSYKELKKLDAAKDTFISVSSHELRTPMTVIKGYTDMLLSESFGKLTDQQKDFLNRIQNNISGLLVLTKDILDISKLEAGHTEFNFETIAVQSWLENICAEHQKEFTEKQAILELQTGPEIKQATLKTDPKELRRVIDNILNNAYRFTPSKGQTTLKADKITKIVNNLPLNYLRIEITDTGPGIPKSDLQRIFEKFVQLENFLQKSYNGTGLGLAIARKIVEGLGGEIWAESELGHGAKFIFLIPFTK